MNSENSANVLLTFNFDAESLWRSSGANTPVFMSQGAYGAQVGVPRILALLERYGIRATFFISGEAANRYPDRVLTIHESEHEIAYHSEARENPGSLFKAEEHTALINGIDALSSVTGNRPTGHRCTSTDFSGFTVELIEQEGFVWDSSLMEDDFNLYAIKQDDKVSTITEIPVSYELNDAMHLLHNHPSALSGMFDQEKVLSIWKSEFDGAYYYNGVFTLTLHPQLVGRWHRLLMLENLIRYLMSKSNVAFLTCSEAVVLESLNL